MNEFAQATAAPLARPQAMTPPKEAGNQKEAGNPKETGNKIGRILESRGKITREQFKSIIALQNEQNLRFGDAAIRLGLVASEDINAVLAEQFAYSLPPGPNSTLDPRLIAIFEPHSPQTEALRSLRSELQLRYFKRGSHLSLAVVGADDAAAIALTAANLAISMAQTGVKTLLIDANLRSPQLNTLFGLNDRNPGLTDLVAARSLVEPLSLPGLGSLWILSAGTEAPNPQELLASKYYEHHLREISSHFEAIIINTPPLPIVMDAQLIAAQAGAALVVAQENTSRLKDIERICSHLRGVGVSLLGAALRQ